LNAFATDEVKDSDYGAMGRVFVPTDVNGDVSVDAEFVGEVFVQVRQVYLLFLDVNVTDFVHGNVDDVGLEIALGHGGSGQIHFDGLQFHHAQAREHEGSEQEEHDVDQGDDLDARFSVGKWGADFHGEGVLRDAFNELSSISRLDGGIRPCRILFVWRPGP
jgi:hypothetical protein